MNYMWADTLASVERWHLLRLLLWAAASIVAGTAILAWMRIGARQSDLLRHFALQCAAWGVIDVLLAASGLAQLHLRDLSEATRLDRLLWFAIGLDTGLLVLGVCLVILGVRTFKRPGLTGAGMGVLVQSGGLLVMDLLLAAQISR